VSIGLEWILSAVIAIVGSLVGVIWSTLNKKIEVLEADAAAAKERSSQEHEKYEDRTKERFADVWGHVNKLRDDTVEIKEMRGMLTSKIENIEKQISELPSYRDFSNLFRESEERMEARMVALIAGARGGK
jgi:hypothetical protein